MTQKYITADELHIKWIKKPELAKEFEPLLNEYSKSTYSLKYSYTPLSNTK